MMEFQKGNSKRIKGEIGRSETTLGVRMQFPRMYRLDQTFDRTEVVNITAAVKSELSRLCLEKRTVPGQRVAITAGSRGIANIATILKALVEFLKAFQTQPFIFPAMGSHGGGTAEGQVKVLAHYQINEDFLGVPVLSSMDVTEIGKTQDGVPVLIDKHALQADFVVVVNRIKPHTKFKAPIESGLMKMMAIGMGKHKGAEYYHRAAAQHTFFKIIVDVGREVLKRVPILCCLGILENGYDETAKIVALRPEEVEEKEKELLTRAKQMMPKLPFDDIDLLIVDEMGKDISGCGIDPNVTGRNRDLMGEFPHPTRVKRLFVRDLTENSMGNATGIGLADVTAKRLVDKIDFKATYMNCITGNSVEKAAIPMSFDTDREAIEVALGSIGLVSSKKAKIVHIQNTLRLNEVEVSETYGDELTERPDLKVLRGPSPMRFDDQGNLLPLALYDRSGGPLK